MKKILSLILSLILSFSLLSLVASCGSNSGNNDDLKGKTTQSVLAEIETEFANTEKYILDEFNTVITLLGNKFSTYRANQQKLYDWFTLHQNKSDELMTKFKDLCVTYFKVVAKTIDNTNKDAIDAALNDFKVKVLDNTGLLGNYYNNIQLAPFTLLDAKYYNGCLSRTDTSGNNDSESYGAWSEVNSKYSNEVPKASKASAGIINSARNLASSNFNKIKTAFESGNFDVDSII